MPVTEKALLDLVSSKDGRTGHNASAWAFGIAIGIHIVALCILAALTWAHTQTASDDTPVASIGRIKAMEETSVIMPKPKIKEVKVVAKAVPSEKTWQLPSLAQEIRTDIGGGNSNLSSLTSKSAAQSPSLLTAATITRGRTEFFGTSSYERKLCFVVDSSGSMAGLLGQVVSQLKQTIDNLEADQYFSIIFFGGNTLIEFKNGKMVRATPESKAEAYKFAKSIRPAGKTDAIRAIKRALEIKDSSGNKAGVIYFLTDGFELDVNQSKLICKEVSQLRNNLAPKVKINTIGFWAQNSDRPVLETIANQSSGQCILINTENTK